MLSQGESKHLRSSMKLEKMFRILLILRKLNNNNKFKLGLIHNKIMQGLMNMVCRHNKIHSSNNKSILVIRNNNQELIF